MFYYAEINSSSVVIAVHSLSEAVTTETYIEITEDQYTNGALVGKGYDYYANEFFTVPAWMGPAYAVQYNDTCLPLTRKLDAIDRNIEATNAAMEIVQNVANEKADEDHTHSAVTSSESGFMSVADKVKLDGIATGANSYTHPDTHPASMIAGLSTVATSGSYNDLSNKPTIPTVPASLPANGGNADTVDGKHASDFAAANHNHDSNYAAIGHNHNTAYAGIDHNHDSDYADVSHTHAAATTSAAGLMSASDKTKLNGIASGANAYTHPSYTAKSSGLYKVTVDDKGHVSAATAVAKADITALGIPSTNTTYSNATTSAAGLMSASDKSKLDGIATGANNYTLPTASSTLGGVKTTSTVTSTSGLTACPIIGGVPYYKDTNNTYSLSSFGITATAAELNKMDGVTATASEINKLDGLTATTAELNYVDGVTSNIQTQLNGKASNSHNHDSDYSAKAMQITSDTGAFKYSYMVADGKNVLTEIANCPTGVFTVYSQAGVAGNPKTSEAWRMLVHKTGNTVLWVKAFGSSGSEYSNYCADGVWQGWRRIYDALPEPLWTGDRYMAATHTVTPTKPLTECANGWLLLWSDYNPGESVQNVDFATTFIPKRAYNGAKWTGHQFLCVVPKHSNTEGDGIIIKTLHISDTEIVGNSLNNASPRNDVVLRAVYEF